MKEVEFWLKGGGTFVCEVDDSEAKSIRTMFSEGGLRYERGYSTYTQNPVGFADKQGGMIVDFRDVSAISIRTVKEKSGAGFQSTESVITGRVKV